MFKEDFKEIISIKKEIESNKKMIHYRVEMLMNHLAYKIYSLEQEYEKLRIQNEFIPIKECLKESPFIKRTHDWPRGYPGDFETVEYIINSKSNAIKNSFGYYIDNFCLTNKTTQQHRNKVFAQSNKIKEIINKNDSARILVVGCGSSPDIFENIELIKNSNTLLDLIDIDEGALLFSKTRLELISHKCNFIHGNIYRIINRLEGKYDLILFGGVLDYIQNCIIARLLKSCFDKLSKKGQLFITNLSKNNYDKIPREYFLNWSLIERDESDIEELLCSSQITDYRLHREPTGLSIIGEIYKY